MKTQEFQFGELVEAYHEGRYNRPMFVRYINTFKQPAPYPDLHFTMAPGETPEEYSGRPSMWFDEIRKIQPENDDLIDIERDNE